MFEQPNEQAFNILYDRLKSQGSFYFLSTSFLRGLTFDNAIIIVDECQNLNFHELDTIITRVGQDSKISFCGDFMQSDLTKRNEKDGLHDFVKILEEMDEFNISEFSIGDIVKHKIYPFRGVIVDVDPEFSNTEDWYQSIPAEIRPSKEQPYYHLMAENTETFYSAYVSQQNLINDGSNGPVDHPDLDQIFSGIQKGKYLLKNLVTN